MANFLHALHVLDYYYFVARRERACPICLRELLTNASYEMQRMTCAIECCPGIVCCMQILAMFTDHLLVAATTTTHLRP